MISHDPTVSGNLRKQQREIRKLGSAPLGPVSVGPGQGSVRFFDASGDQFQIFPSGAWVRFRGGMQSVAARFENDASAIEGHTATLGEHDGRITVNKNRNDAQDGVLTSHGTRLGSAESRLTGHDGDISAHNTRINNAQSTANTANSAAGTAQSRADSAYTRAGTGISNAATAQSRADSAYTRAGNAQSAAESAGTAAATAAARAAKIINCINSVSTSGARMQTMSIQPMAEADVWLQLRNCINS